MLGNENYPDHEAETSNKDCPGSLGGRVSYKELFVDAAISAAISQTGDDLLEKLMKVDDSLRGRTRLHTAEDVEVAIDESVEKIIASRHSSPNGDVQEPAPEEAMIHGYTQRGLEILAACSGLTVEFVIEMLETSAKRQEYDLIVQIIREGSWVVISEWLDKFDLENSRGQQPRLPRVFRWPAGQVSTASWPAGGPSTSHPPLPAFTVTWHHLRLAASVRRARSSACAAPRATAAPSTASAIAI